MDNNNNNIGRYGLGLFDVLAVVFIVLKLTDVINWHWGWILSPIWIPLALVLIIMLFAWGLLTLMK